MKARSYTKLVHFRFLFRRLPNPMLCFFMLCYGLRRPFSGPPIHIAECERPRDARVRTSSSDRAPQLQLLPTIFSKKSIHHLVTFKLDFLSEYASARQTGYTYVIPKTYSKFGGGVIFFIFFLENLHQALIKFWKMKALMLTLMINCEYEKVLEFSCSKFDKR